MRVVDVAAAHPTLRSANVRPLLRRTLAISDESILELTAIKAGEDATGIPSIRYPCLQTRLRTFGSVTICSTLADAFEQN